MNPSKLRALIRAQRKVPIFNRINLWELVDDVAVGVDLQMSAGLELSGLPDVLLKGEEEIGVYLGAVKKLLHSVPDETTLQFVVQSRQGDPEKVREYLALNREKDHGSALVETVLKAKETFLTEKFIQKRRTLLFLTTYPKSIEDMPRAHWGSFVEFDRSWTTEIHQRRLRLLNSIVSNLTDSLKNLGISGKRLTSQELGAYFFEHLNPVTSRTIPCPHVTADQPLTPYWTARSLLAQNACENRYEHFLVDGTYHKAVNLLLLPETLDVSDMAGLASELWPDYNLSLSIHCVSYEKLLAKLKTSGNIAKALSFSSFGSRYEAQQKYTELDELIREVRSTSQKLFTFSFCVLFRGRDLPELEEKTALGLKSLQTLGSAGGLIDNLLHEDLTLSLLPNHTHLNSRRYVVNTEPLIRLLPLHAPWYGTKLPKMLFENPQGELVNMDIFDPTLPAKHSILVGTTGSGKSFTCNYLLTHFIIESQKNHVVIIDIGGSYRKLCHLFEGQYLNVELSEKFAFNPLPPKRSLFDGKEYDPDEIAYLTLIIQRMVLDQDEALNSLGETVLEKSIKEAYGGLPLEGAPALKDVRRALTTLEGDEETKALANHYYKNFEVWTEGRYSKIFNSTKRLEIDNRLIVFDLEKLGNHPRLQSVYFYVIREIIDSKLRDKSLKKMIVIDEGWRFFNDDIGSRLIENLYRTARKNNGLILSISQSPVDFLSTKAANAIITNSYIKYVLRLTKGHDLLPQFGFTQGEIEAIKGLTSVPRKFSDLFLKFNEHSTVIRVEPSPLDYWICTTDAEDAMKEEKVRQDNAGASHAQILEILARGSGN